MKFIKDTPIIGCGNCLDWEGSISIARPSRASGERILCCPKCRTILVERSGDEFMTLHKCKIVKATADALTEYDLGKLLLGYSVLTRHRDKKKTKQSTSSSDLGLIAAFRCFRIPDGFDPMSIPFSELLAEETRRHPAESAALTV